MKNRTGNKILSLVLVIAICVSTVCGTIVSVNAANAGKTYSIVGDSVAASTKTTTMTVTITDPNGISKGSFDLMFGKDVIDDANFDTNGNYLDIPVGYTLEDLVGEKTINYVFNDKWEATSAATQWATSAPANTSETKWEVVNTRQVDNWVNSTVQYKVSQVPQSTSTVTYTQSSTKVQDNWTKTGNTKRENYNSTGIIEDNGDTRWVWNNNIDDWKQGSATGQTQTVGWFDTTPSSDNTYSWVKTEDNFMNDVWTQYYKLYLYEEEQNDPTYNYTKSENKPITEYEYKEYKKVYDEVISYGESKLDKDKNGKINGTNIYKMVMENIYDDMGNVIGQEEKKVLDTEATKAKEENSSNKGALLPNAYDSKNGLWNTKIEITDGTKAEGSFSITDFKNTNYETFAKGDLNTQNAIEGETDDRKYVYNQTDDYFTAHSSSMKDVSLAKYYREYTTIDVETTSLSYDISTVSEDMRSSISVHENTQYAQGFKNISFDAGSSLYTSITFTVTFDFTGVCDRISANSGVDIEKIYETDGRWATENYVDYGKKYQLNLLNPTGDISNTKSESNNENTSYFHTHTGTINQATAQGDPLNKAAIEALGSGAVEGVDYFELYNATCSICKRVTPMMAGPNLYYTVEKENDDGTTSRVPAPKGEKGAYSFNNYRNVSGISLTYQNDGSVSMDVHYPSHMDGEQLIVTDENGIVLAGSDVIDEKDVNYENYESKGVAVESFYAAKKLDENIAKYTGQLMSSAHMVTVSGFSAADADKKLYIARYTPKSATENHLMGITNSISLADYCNKVINGKASYMDENHEKNNSSAGKLIAAAFINYARAAKTALTTPNDYKARDVVDVWEANEKLNQKWDASNLLDGKLADKGEKGDSWENAIIIDSAEELAYLSKLGGESTKGKYYKVADGIRAFYMHPEITEQTDYAAAMTILETENKYWESSASFQGHFDGNGVIISGIQSNPKGSFAGLFPQITNDVTIKNTTLTNCRFIGQGKGVGAVAGIYNEVTSDVSDILFEKVSVYNCYISNSNSTFGAGAILGYAGNTYDSNGSESGGWVNGKISFNNCYINLTEDMLVSVAYDNNKSNASHGGLAAYIATSTCYASNCVVIGIAPYTRRIFTYPHLQSTGWQFAKAGCFSNIYTTHICNDGYNNGQDSDKTANTDSDIAAANQDYTGRIFTLTETQMKDVAAKENMSALDWDFTWKATNQGVELYTPYNRPKTASEKTIYWDGKVTKPASTATGTKDNPVIISTAAELAYIVADNASYSLLADGSPKYFKIADGIKNIVLQSEIYADEIMALPNATKVQEYFEENTSKLLKWKQYGWEQTAFCGYFDGNGATVYGLYQDGGQNSGLFSTVDAGASIHDIAVKNSYMKTSWYVFDGKEQHFQVGAIAAVTSSNEQYGLKQNGVIWIDGCTVANNYMHNTSPQHTRSGVVFGSAADTIYFDNCLVYGNDATYGDGINMPFYSNGLNSTLTTARKPVELTNVKIGYDEAANSYFHYNAVRNCIILGADAMNTQKTLSYRMNEARCFENVYSDGQVGAVTYSDGKTQSFGVSQVKKIASSDIYGLTAKSVMPELNWYDAQTNPSGAWYCSYISGMPSLRPLNENLGDIYPAYNAITFTPDIDASNSDDVFFIADEDGSMNFGVYSTGLNLKANPYISFAFAFRDEYKENRDKISITFKYTVNGVQYVYGDDEVERAALAIPVYIEGQDIKSANGWTNGKANGRYHTYKFTGVPVEALANGIEVYASYEGDDVNEAFSDKYLGTYSASGLGYAFDQLNSEETPSEYYATRADAVRALMFYAQAIHARYGNI